jgi:hypothetical protein
MLHTQDVGSSVACLGGWQLCCLPRRLAVLLPTQEVGSYVAYPGIASSVTTK